MTARLNSRDAGFAEAFARLVEERREEAVDVRDAVTRILVEVRNSGDSAVAELTRRFDRFEPPTEGLGVPAQALAAARERCEPAALAALELAAERIRAFHRRQVPEDLDWVDDAGVRLGMRWRPIDAVGIYVPGGTAAYPSSVLMNAIPAKVAGVGRIVMAAPTPDGSVNPLVLAAAWIADVNEVYRVGGAQAIGALAYGTASIAPVDKIVGPGNAWVAEAKRQVFGRVGIDMIAGPSEVVVVAQAVVDPDWVAADLLSQAEHDDRAQAVLITDDAVFAESVIQAVEVQLTALPRSSIAAASWRALGAVIVVGRIAEAAGLVDALAPEHLELIGPDAEALAQTVRHAGSIFLGPLTSEVIGDYVGGPNHVLPTARTARFASGLSVYDFLKRTTLLGCDQASFTRLGPHAATLARAEGLDAHAEAVERRLRSLA
ncbi:MAG: histidinol dehydrogenase [Geminicoccaceae bacterium]